MADDAASVPVTPATPSPKKKAKNVGAKKTKTAPSHPKVSEMVVAAITNLKERGGSSLQAIKKYVGSHYKVDLERLTPFLKKYLKSAVASGTLVQTKGKGATGSFKLSATGQKSKEPGKKIKKPLAKKQAAVKKAKPSNPKKAAKPKPKSSVDKAKKKVAKKSPVKKTASKAKSPKKTTKPKAPKAKKLKPTTPKKAAAKKASKK